MAVKKSVKRLLGMKEITEYTGYSRTTVVKMINEENFPAAKLNGSGWESDTELIDSWRTRKIQNMTDQTPVRCDNATPAR